MAGHVASMRDVNHKIADSDVSSRGGHLGGQPIAGLEHVQVDVEVPHQQALDHGESDLWSPTLGWSRRRPAHIGVPSVDVLYTRKVDAPHHWRNKIERWNDDITLNNDLNPKLWGL